MKVPEASCYQRALSSQVKVPPFKDEKKGKEQGKETQGTESTSDSLNPLLLVKAKNIKKTKQGATLWRRVVRGKQPFTNHTESGLQAGWRGGTEHIPCHPRGTLRNTFLGIQGRPLNFFGLRNWWGTRAVPSAFNAESHLIPLLSSPRTRCVCHPCNPLGQLTLALSEEWQRAISFSFSKVKANARKDLPFYKVPSSLKMTSKQPELGSPEQQYTLNTSMHTHYSELLTVSKITHQFLPIWVMFSFRLLVFFSH